MSAEFQKQLDQLLARRGPSRPAAIRAEPDALEDFDPRRGPEPTGGPTSFTVHSGPADEEEGFPLSRRALRRAEKVRLSRYDDTAEALKAHRKAQNQRQLEGGGKLSL